MDKEQQLKSMELATGPNLNITYPIEYFKHLPKECYNSPNHVNKFVASHSAANQMIRSAHYKANWYTLKCNMLLACQDQIEEHLE